MNFDKQELRALKRVRNDNHKMLSLCSEYLNKCPRAINKELIDELCADGTDKETAFLSVLIYIFDLDEENIHDSAFVRKYLIPSIKEAHRDAYFGNSYRKLLSGIVTDSDNWSLREEKYAAFEAFPCGEGACDKSFAEYPDIAFFDADFSYPAIFQNQVEWMSLKPNEIETMREPIDNAFGNVTVFGLGLGYFAFCVSEKEDVKSVTIVERDKELTDLFSKAILPLFPNRDKINIVLSDAFEYMEKELPKTDTDYAFVDIWHDTSDGLPLYMKAKKYESLCKSVRFDYWIEESVIRRLRWLVFDEYTGDSESLLLGLPKIGGVDDLREMMKTDSLKALAGRIEYKE